MTVVAVIGDCTTTTSVAIASAWDAADDVVIVEADRSGGSLAGWLDTPPVPSLSTIVTQSNRLDASRVAAWSALDPMVQRAASGVRFIAAPVRSREADRAIDEARRTVFPVLADLPRPIFLADCGRCVPADPLPHLVSVASAVVLVHRQSQASAAAAAVRLERLAESVQQLLVLGCPIELAVIGDRPFDVDEIGRFVVGGEHGSTNLEGASVHRAGVHGPDGAITVHGLGDDALSAAVVAGRTGVSARRLRRLPLWRTSRTLADALRDRLGHDHDAEAQGAELHARDRAGNAPVTDERDVSPLGTGEPGADRPDADRPDTARPDANRHDADQRSAGHGQSADARLDQLGSGR